MKKILAIYVLGFLLITSCDSDSPPAPTPEPDVKAPSEANLSLPENNKECEQGEINGNNAVVEFRWQASADTDNYDLKVTNLDSNVNTVKAGLTSTVAEVSLERGHPYSWQVTSKNSGAISNNSSTWRFYLAGDGESNFAPFPSNAVSPTPGATVNPDNGKVSLIWEDVQDPDGDSVTYTIYVDTTDGYQTTKPEWSNISGTSLEISVETNTVYYWRVLSSDGNNSASTGVFTFKTSG
ncbi:hypothetical protein [Christiangramia sabulilitoris]|uniref:Fibronectin type-III domain-containing protein n=1 Tax=Christiangramia sabulilitoris TaxID=2583991 RepID=A0A550I2L1_9FLAO|nr:hypothetical protein [Christiangramia sabulilitoris]TRO65210.1 hypothetical protein FGM01_07315 [Christiangramia sabulilitoris]